MHRERRLRRRLGVAVCASLIGAGAIGNAASAVDDGRSNAPTASRSQLQAAQTGALAQAAPAPVHGAAEDGTEFNGTFTVQRFKEQRGTLYAVGQLDGDLGGRAVSRHVSLPVSGASNEAPAEGLTGPHGFAVQQTPGACSILTLDLGPLDLNLLGLRVFLDEVHLLIEAIPGAGALLGNLLCSVAGLLDGGLLGGQLAGLLSAITGLLNAILAF